MLSHPGLYVHMPWCVKKCPYCDFNSHPLKAETDFQAYTAAVQADLAAELQAHPDTMFSSVFFGGGTPSLFPADDFARVLERVPMAKACEITMEANPGTLEYTEFGDYRRAGINRLSIGAQSFDPDALQRLGRIHNPDDTHKAFANARHGGIENINLDIMWGLPQQTVAQSLTDLEAAISLQPEHISWYQLTLEPKTEFAKRPPLLPREATLVEMEAAGFALLAEAGYERYEVSAFSRNGCQSAHNLNYWRFGDYVGIGAGAHGKATDVASSRIQRHSKATQPRLYLKQPTAMESSTVDPADLPLEFMMNTLRLTKGVPFDVFEAGTGLAWSTIADRWQKLVEEGLVRPDRCATTPMGLRYLDSVLAEFLSRT